MLIWSEWYLMRLSEAEKNFGQIRFVQRHLPFVWITDRRVGRTEKVTILNQNINIWLNTLETTLILQGTLHMAKLYQFRRIIIGCVIVVVICNFLIIQAIYDDIVHDFRLAVLNKLQFSQMFLKLFERQKLNVKRY